MKKSHIQYIIANLLFILMDLEEMQHHALGMAITALLGIGYIIASAVSQWRE